MLRKRKPLYIIFDQTLFNKKRRLNRTLRFLYLILALIGLYFAQSILLVAIVIFTIMFINHVFISPKFHHQIQLFSDGFAYLYKAEAKQIEYSDVAYIDQDVIEVNGEFFYNNLTLLNEQFEEHIVIRGRYFDYTNLVDFCQHIQDTNLSSRTNYYNLNEQFLESVKAIDETTFID